MSRRSKLLLLILVPIVALASWQWLRPYSWDAPGDAPGEIQFARLSRDHGYHWLDLRLKLAHAGPFSFDQPIELVTTSDRHIAPAEVTLEGSREEQRYEHVSLKFWLEPGDLNGPLDLNLNGSTLPVRTRASEPDLPDGEGKFFHTDRW